MKLHMTNEAVFSIPMAGAAVWTAITGDTFLPSLAGAAFAVYFRSQREAKSPDNASYVWRDLAATGVMSFVIGLIAGPYLASQLPEGEGVVGVGALIASFIGMSVAAKLNRMNWDAGAILRAFGGGETRKK